MKRKLILIVLCFAAFGLSAQKHTGKSDDERGKERFEKFQEERISYISREMKLTEEEGKLFWPLCNELQMKKFEANKELREKIKKIKKTLKEKNKANDAEYKEIIELSAEVKLKEAQLEKEYTVKFLQVLSAEKIFLYRKAEQDFGRKMMEKRKYKTD